MYVLIPYENEINYLREDKELIYICGGRYDSTLQAYHIEQMDIEIYIKLLDGQFHLHPIHNSNHKRGN